MCPNPREPHEQTSAVYPASHDREDVPPTLCMALSSTTITPLLLANSDNNSNMPWSSGSLRGVTPLVMVHDLGLTTPTGNTIYPGMDTTTTTNTTTC